MGWLHFPPPGCRLLRAPEGGILTDDKSRKLATGATGDPEHPELTREQLNAKPGPPKKKKEGAKNE